jgi:hypothetical protein
MIYPFFMTSYCTCRIYGINLERHLMQNQLTYIPKSKITLTLPHNLLRPGLLQS